MSEEDPKVRDENEFCRGLKFNVISQTRFQITLSLLFRTTILSSLSLHTLSPNGQLSIIN